MAFNFSDHLETMLTADNFGERTTYTPPSPGSPVTVDAAWVENAPTAEEAVAGRDEGITAVVKFRISDITIAERKATVTRASTGEVWTVEKAQLRRGVIWELTVKRRTNTETSQLRFGS